jgi:hypothetical protein
LAGSLLSLSLGLGLSQNKKSDKCLNDEQVPERYALLP